MNERANDERLPIAAAVVVDDGRVLLIRRRVEEAGFRGSSRPEKWSRESLAMSPRFGRPSRKRAWSYEPSRAWASESTLTPAE